MMSHNYASAVLTALVVISLFSGATTATSATTSFADRSVEATSDVPFDHSKTEANNSSVSLENDGDRFAFDAAANQTVRGQTTFEPGTELLVQIHARGQFFKTQTVVVQSDGSFAGLFNFTGYDPGVEFGVVVAAAERNATEPTPLAVSDGILREGPASATNTGTLSTMLETTETMKTTETTATTTANDAGAKTESDTETGTDDTIESDARTEATTETKTETEAAMEMESETQTSTSAEGAEATSETTAQSSDSGGQPGFGLLAALAALAGIAVFSRRY
ncbi:hypothetical protein SAMN05421858_2404 [Haladaptatus litoreus]|uniref:PGF-CTERM protein n=1 Tax=Haladaptatus litoreus TaxID=553468 RepID=A0A1N7B8C2_9EURY|nr:BGTF surface domain-containing protein [Haladaptatus litoreus]SIR47611.1 hypothetical protein SAMN05421858_2404 [Haladaptatus litoreus]